MKKFGVIWALLIVIGASQALAVEWDPRGANADAILEDFEKNVQNKSEKKGWLSLFGNKKKKKAPKGIDRSGNCQRKSCPVWLQISKSEQRAYLHVNGKLEKWFWVSTGLPGFTTPDFDRNPNGRIYDQYTSRKYAGGDYAGLGNMPYAVFIAGGYAVHGTPKSNIQNLGARASHGCVRMHPIGGKLFNELVRAEGRKNTWITIHQ